MSSPAASIPHRQSAGQSSTESLLEAQRHVLEMVVRGRPLLEVLTALCTIVDEQSAGTARAAILLADADYRTLSTGAAPSLPDAYNRAVNGLPVDASVGTCCAAAARRTPVITRDIASDPGWATLSHLPLALGLKAAWSLPIESSDGNLLGTFGTYFVEKREPTASERRLVEFLAHTAALAIERDATDAALRAGARRDRFLAELSTATQPLGDAEEIIATSARLLAEFLDVDRCAYAPIEDERVFVITGNYTRGVPDILGRWDIADFGPGCVADLFAGTPYVVEDTDTDSRIGKEFLAAYRATDIRAVVCVPLHKQGRLTAAMAVHQKTPRRFLPDEIALVATVTARCWEALERVRVTRTMHDSDLALVKNRSRLDYAARLSGVGFWYCPLPLGELFWDERVKDHFFLPPDSSVSIEDFYARMHPEDREATRVDIETAIQERRIYDTVYRTVNPVDGEIKWIRALGGATYSTEGQPTYFDGVTVDVTAQKRDQERLARVLKSERAQARLLEEQDRRKDEFLATLAHELRNPLAPIRTGLHFLRLGGTGEQAARTHEMMERQLRHMVRMVDDLLDISRITLGKVELRKERIDFRAVLNSALETTRPLIEAANHEFAVRLPAEPLPLDADPTRLAQILANLVNNAAKYTPAGGRIQLAAETDADSLIVRVSDSGIGIPRDMLPRVFDMFTQVGRSIDQSQGGLGIGLTLVRRLLDMHGGTVDAESGGVGLGSTFTVRLPLASPVAATADLPGVMHSRSPRKILIVDDNADAAESLGMLLELDGHTTHITHDGESALHACATFEPDTVFLDIGLPGIDGYEVARRLRQRHGSKLRLVALTGWGTDEDRRLARAAGFDRHLVKPVDPGLLGEALAP